LLLDAINSGFNVYAPAVPWRKLNRDKLRGAEAFIRRRVKGQTHVVTQMLDIVKRAVGGLSERRAGSLADLELYSAAYWRKHIDTDPRHNPLRPKRTSKSPVISFERVNYSKLK